MFGNIIFSFIFCLVVIKGVGLFAGITTEVEEVIR